MFKLPHNCTHSHASKVILIFFQDRLQQYMNWELPDVQARSRKCKGTRDQIVNIHWIIEKEREFHKNIYFCFIDYAKAFDCVDHSKLWKILKEMGIPDNVICFLRNLYAGQEATVRTGHGTMEWFQIGKRICQSCILSPCLFNLESTSWEMPGWLKHKLTSRLPGFEISVTSDMERTPPYGREWRRTKEFFIKVKEESEIAGIKLNIQTTKIIASGHIIHGKQMGKEWKQWQILFSWVPKSLQMVVTAMILKNTCTLEENEELKQHIKKWRHYFANKICLVKDMFFPVVMYGCEGWSVKKAEELML